MPAAAVAAAAGGAATDPLLGCLLFLARLLVRPVSADAATAGLPLVDNRLTPQLFVRAAERCGLSAQVVKRPLDRLDGLLLPAVVLLDGAEACVLIERGADSARIVLPATGTGEQTVPLADLERRHTGYLILAKPAFRFDARSADAGAPRARHWFWGVVLRSWPLYGEVLVASLLINVFALITPLFTMNVYDRVVPNRAMETLWALAIGVGIVIVFDLAVRSLRAYFIDVAGKRIDAQLSTSIFERVLGIRMAVRPPSVGAFASGLQEFESFRDFLTSATITTLVDLPFVVLFIAAMFWVSGPLAWVAVVSIPVIVGASLALQGPISRVVQQSMRASAQRQAALIESLVGLETIKITGAAGAAQRKWEDAVGEIARLGLRSRFLSGAAVNFSSFAQQIANVAVVVYGVYLIAEDRLTLGALIAATLLTGRALAPLGQVASLVTRYHQSRMALASIDRLMNLPVEREPGKDYVHRARLAGAVEFRDVSFAYPGQSADALAGVSFRIAPGERVGIIGRIGSGKTTIEKLILGLYEPRSGAVLVDGVDARQIDPAALRRDIGYVPQDVMLFYGSVRDNIVLGAPHAEDAAVLRAARLSGVNEFVDRSASGFDLQVGERGEALSGGQRQAIAIARAELLAPPILVMDEPTSSMDNRSEEAFKARLAESLGGRTLLLITHRASMLSLVSRVLVMDQGRLVADGPKDAVLAALAEGKIRVRAS